MISSNDDIKRKLTKQINAMFAVFGVREPTRIELFTRPVTGLNCVRTTVMIADGFAIKNLTFDVQYDNVSDTWFASPANFIPA